MHKCKTIPIGRGFGIFKWQKQDVRARFKSNRVVRVITHHSTSQLPEARTHTRTQRSLQTNNSIQLLRFWRRQSNITYNIGKVYTLLVLAGPLTWFTTIQQFPKKTIQFHRMFSDSWTSTNVRLKTRLHLNWQCRFHELIFLDAK